MDEHISRKKALEAIHKWCNPCGSGIEAILAIPAEDVVKVVRCKNCVHHRELTEQEKFYVDEDSLICTNSNFTEDAWNSVWPDDFCPYGEREELNG